MRNDAIIFDVDGTLWNACLASASGWNYGLKKIGIKRVVTFHDLESVAGNPYKKCIEIILPGLQETHPNLFEVLDACENEAIKINGGIFYDGVIEGIKNLAKSYKVFIVSNCARWYLDLFLDFSGLRPFVAGFDCNGMSGLPKNEMLAKMEKNFYLKNPVYVGDTASDEEAVRLAGMDFIYVSYGFGKPKGNPRTCDSFGSLVDYFMKKNG
ncbi:MAG TPA: HAD-IA family hydrolase [Candidatus Pacearchaeota archaeon]|jgi:phosphoglycolate phosphatase|nr:HAD-IA family hydrolase [Candidatus Pacearchaeota archaeon]